MNNCCKIKIKNVFDGYHNKEEDQSRHAMKHIFVTNVFDGKTSRTKVKTHPRQCYSNDINQNMDVNSPIHKRNETYLIIFRY